MALKQIILRKKVDGLRRQLADLVGKAAELESRAVALATREAELATAVEETTVETPAEDQATIEAEVASYEGDKAALDKDTSDQAEAKKKLEDEIRILENELKEIDDKSKDVAQEAPAPQRNERKDTHMETTRTRFFDGMDIDRRSAMIARDEVKQFAARVRDLKGQNRAVTGAELEIPVILLDVLRDNLHRYSKLASKVFLKPVAGKSRQTVAGAVPEGVWTEATGVLNELALSYSQLEVDGFKVGGFIPVPNSTLEDSDLNLVNDVMDAIGQAIGKGVDKAILFGSGTKMPTGIVTRLAQTSAPSAWGTNRAAWTDLHTSNLLKFNPAGMTNETFWANMIAYLGVAKQNYSDGSLFWAMSQATFNTLKAKALAFNANGFLVSNVDGTLPVIGGDVVVLDFITDNDIIGGYGSLFLLAERAGAQLAVSDQVKFMEDQTVFKGSARYDGQPVFGEGFVVLNINNASPTTTPTVAFGSDSANVANVPYALPIAGSYTGAQAVQLFSNPGTDIYYTVDGSTPDKTKTKYTGAAIAVAASKSVKAIAYKGSAESAVLTAAYVIS